MKSGIWFEDYLTLFYSALFCAIVIYLPYNLGFSVLTSFHQIVKIRAIFQTNNLVLDFEPYATMGKNEDLNRLCFNYSPSMIECIKRGGKTVDYKSVSQAMALAMFKVNLLYQLSFIC